MAMTPQTPSTANQAVSLPETSAVNADRAAIAPYPVAVKILLAGGHQHAVTLSSDAPLLHQLFTVLANHGQPQAAPTLLQIPVDDGQRAVAFSSNHLVGIETHPPIFAQRQPQVLKPNVTQFATANAPLSQPTYRYIQIENFFPPELHQELVDYAVNNRQDYVETGPATNTELYKDHRNSWVIYYPKYTQPLLDRLNQVMPKVREYLGLPQFEVGRIETQLTAHNDGNYYKIHNDNSSEDTASRVLTYVYYFYREPKGFEGGNLEIYDTEMRDGHAFAGDKSQIVEPLNNSIVFFPSHYLHEVLPVKCASGDFADSRFTLNGWIRHPH